METLESSAQVVERGLHHRVLQRVSRTMLEDGRVIEMTNAYTEIGNCLHYQNQKDGQWLESKAEFRLFPGGAVADAAPNRLIVLPDIAEEGSIDFLDSSGKRFLTTPRWLAYFDPVTQQSVIVAAVKSCIGQQVEPNVIVWADAFDDILAAIRVTYWPWGMEQEVVLLESSDALRPGAWGLNENNPVLLEMWSEVHESPEAQSTAHVAEDGLVDVNLDFGVVQIGSGKAFVLGDEETEVAVHKTWTKVDGQRQFLIEAVRQAEIEPLLAKLPQQARANNPAQRARALAQRKPVQGRAALLAQVRSLARPAPSEGPLRAATDRADVQKAAPVLPLPGERAGVKANLSSSKNASTGRGASTPNETRTASIRLTGTNLTRGVTIDYSIVQPITNMVFKPETYLVLSDTTLAGVTTIWGGACIKFTNSASTRLKCTGPIDCRTAPYWPAFFVAWKDDTVGEIINGSDGNPGTNIFAGRALELNDTSATAQLHDLRFRNCDKALYLNAGTVELSHSQIGNGIIAVNIGGGSSVWLRNVLAYDLRGSALATPVGKNLYAENVTFHRLYKFRDSGTVNLTNCLMICVTNNLSWDNAANIQTNISDAGIFQTVGAGSRYLAAGSSYRNAGTTNINSTLLADLKQRTTYPPLVLSGDFLADTTLYPAAQRDADVLDLGYHFDALDYCWTGLNLSNATLRLAAGVSVAVYGTNGITLRNGAKFISQGTPLNMNHLVRYQAVQELATNWGPTAGTMSLFKIPYTSTLPEVRFRGTDISLISDALYEALVLDFLGNVIAALEFKDCVLRGGFIDLRFWCNNPSALLTLGMTNSLLEFARYEFTQAYGGDPTRLAVHMRNNLVQYGPMGLNNLTNTTTWTIHDNLLDNVVLWCGSSIYITNSHNAYCNTTNLPGTLGNNVTLTTLDYQQGALSRLYYPTNGTNLNLLREVGSRNATNAGLYSFTTTTDQIPETNSVVDIGWHLLAVNASTLQPLDFDGDGVPDVIEDANNNGSVDSGETAWNNSSDLGLKIIITRPKSGGNLP